MTEDTDKKQIFLENLAKTGNLSLACQAAAITRRQATMLRKLDSAFANAYDEAMDDAADRLEAEAWRRALEGVVNPVIKAGKPVLDPVTGEAVVIRRYSDPLLVMLLKGCKPDKFAVRGMQSVAADPAHLIQEIATDNDPPRAPSIS
jgi:hypothetical protein